MTTRTSKSAAFIRDAAHAVGFDSCAIAHAGRIDDLRPRLERFVALGRHGTMGWMEETLDRRSHPQVLWPQARSIIMLGLSYGPDSDPMETLDQRDVGTISVYARNRDYHDIIKGRLKTLASKIVSRLGGGVKVFVDTAPVMEKPLAQAAGLGWQGKHTNLVSREHGSWLFLGAIFTTLDLPEDEPETDHCGSCRRCLDICPTDAFPAPYQLDARRCISYLTIEHKGRSRWNSARRWATGSMVVMTAWRCARGTSSPALRARPNCRRARTSTPRALPIFWRSTMQRSARFSPARRSSASGAIGSCATA
jgi:epoxyqueuosine reductase